MNRVDELTVQKIAGLANLELTSEEIDYYQLQMSRILDYMSDLDIELDNIPNDWRFDLEREATPERSDSPISFATVDKVLSSAPKVVGSAFQVPKIIE